MHPSEVAKVIVEVVTSDNPDLRYIVGKDAATMIEEEGVCQTGNFMT